MSSNQEDALTLNGRLGGHFIAWLMPHDRNTSPQLHKACVSAIVGTGVRVDGVAKWRGQGLGNNLLGFDLVCHITILVRTASQETHTGVVTRSTSNESEVDGTREDVDFWRVSGFTAVIPTCLVKGAVDYRQDPLTALLWVLEVKRRT